MEQAKPKRSAVRENGKTEKMEGSSDAAANLKRPGVALITLAMPSLRALRRREFLIG